MTRPRLTIRTRLTVVYGGLFLLAGLVMLAIIYTLAQFMGSTILLGDTTGSPVPTGLGGGAIEKLYNEARAQMNAGMIIAGLVSLIVVGGITTWIGWLLAGRMLDPLSQITATARRIAAAPDTIRRSHERIALDAPHDEIHELADTFDLMLSKLNASFDSQRRFVANASHELRTPLTLNRALLEVASRKPDTNPETKILAETLLEINARHERLIEGLLALARAEQDQQSHEFIDLADIVEHVERTLAHEGIHIENRITEAHTHGDALLLEQMTRNLLENAVNHNLTHDGWIRVSTFTDASGAALLVIANSGDVLPRYALEDLFRPFRRVTGERLASTRGAGLGLSIVQAIVGAHDGHISLSAPDSGGLTVEVRLPGAKLRGVTVRPAEHGNT